MIIQKNLQAEKEQIEKKNQEYIEKYDKVNEELNHVTAQWVCISEQNTKNLEKLHELQQQVDSHLGGKLKDLITYD